MELQEIRSLEEVRAEALTVKNELSRLEGERGRLARQLEDAVRRGDVGRMVELKRRADEIAAELAAGRVNHRRLEIEQMEASAAEAKERGASLQTEAEQLIAEREPLNQRVLEINTRILTLRGGIEGAEQQLRQLHAAIPDAKRELEALIRSEASSLLASEAGA